MTEQRLAPAQRLDDLSVEKTLRLINQADQSVAAGVAAAIASLTAFTEDALIGLESGGRLIYVGAGTSGRLGVLDASECPPTFCTDPGLVQALIAGGNSALRRSSEGMEDDPEGAWSELSRLSLTPKDSVLGIAAGGTTPYVWGALQHALACAANTGMLMCVRHADVVQTLGDVPPVRHVMELLVGPEVVTGSTRMKAGTATKLALNMISTTLMAQLGKTWGDLMVDVRATNAKLRDRATRILMSQTDLTRTGADALLDAADGRVKTALVMHRRSVAVSEAEKLLESHSGRLYPILGPPR